MRLRNLALVAAFVGVGIGPVFADVVRTDALPYHGGSPAPPAGYNNPDWNDGVQNGGIPGERKAGLAYRYSVTFTVTAADAGVWTFRAGIDFGHGDMMVLNGKVLRTQAHDISSNESYSNSVQFQQWSVDLAPGAYTLIVYGAENCCDGGARGQFMPPASGGFQEFKTTSSAVPEISTWTMMLAGFAGLGFTGYVRTKKDSELAAQAIARTESVSAETDEQKHGRVPRKIKTVAFAAAFLRAFIRPLLEFRLRRRGAAHHNC
jgi:hypothetical protein